MKIHSLRANPNKPSVVKEYGYWWARTRNTNGGCAMSAHATQEQAFNAAQKMAVES